MDSGFEFKVNKISKDLTEWSIKGQFGEDAKIPNDLDLPGIKELHVNFAGTNFINSSGIKTWIRLVDQMEQNPSLTVVFKNCPQMVINQVNLIEGFLPKNGTIESVYLPIYCNKCDNVFDVPIEIEQLDFQLYSALDRVKPNNCEEYPACKSHMEIDVVTKDYFRFIKS